MVGRATGGVLLNLSVVEAVSAERSCRARSGVAECVRASSLKKGGGYPLDSEVSSTSGLVKPRESKGGSGSSLVQLPEGEPKPVWWLQVLRQSEVVVREVQVEHAGLPSSGGAAGQWVAPRGGQSSVLGGVHGAAEQSDLI